MKSLADASLRRTVAVILAALVVVVAGTWYAVKLATDRLLYQDATASAETWATNLVNQVPDIEQIANGETPTSESMVFFRWASRTGSVFRYVVYNRFGYSQLVSEDEVLPVGLSEYSEEAVKAIETGLPVVDVHTDDDPSRPDFYGHAFVPVFVDGRPIAVISAFVDETVTRANFRQALLAAGGSLSLLTALAFALPAFAWYRRTKEKQLADRRIRYLAHHDGLTGLINRPRLMELLDNAVVARLSEGSGLAVHFIDLDKFKEVNDTLGHDGGDFLLKTVAERLRSVSRPADLVARLGGDEFVVIQNAVTDKDQAAAFAERLRAALTPAVPFNGHEIVSAASVGVALAPADGAGSDRLLKCADLALYESKSEGRNRVSFFAPEMDAELQARLAMEKLVRQAARDNTLVLHYQPVYGAADRNLIGFEALVRLPRADGSLIKPEVFIPVAEDLRVIDRIGAWILKEACRTAATWPEHLTVAVNLSPVQFETGSVSQTVRDALEETGLAAARLELEITETLLLRDNEAIMAELRALKDMGVSVVMDDFGTGYSSLSYLWRFPFNKIKIDGSFIQALDGSRRDAETVIRTIIALGRQLHMQVTVEGVETAGQAAFLNGAEAEQVQGFYFSHPIAAEDLAACIMADVRQRTTPDDAAPPEQPGSRRQRA